MTTAAATATPRLVRRVAVAALATLFVASAGPASAAPTGDDRGLGSGGLGWSSARSAHASELHGPALPLIFELRARLEPASATGAPTEVQVAGPRARRSGPFSMNLFRKGDFVSQQTDFWCIPASTQIMMNIMDDGRPNRSRAKQARLYRIGDRLEEDGTFSDDPEPDRWNGMGISEWVGLLNRYDYGPYELAGAKSRQKSLRIAARMMRKTGKPVGLVVWRGAHAWVMSGFTATADPAVTNDFTVTSVWVHDPWYPRVSSIWGRSRPANANVSPRVLGQDFKPYGRPGRRNPERDGRYMLVVPRPERGTSAAA